MQQTIFEDKGMLRHIFAQLFSTLIELLCLSRLSTDEKDLEILLLRQQLDVMVRKQTHTIRPSRPEKWTLAVLTSALNQRGQHTTQQYRRKSKRPRGFEVIKADKILL
ncbi:MAG: hypothetical protein GY759_14740 [Chloroflexi bacterium]|nr:hypothetical protein [Chloroflexota bacterium]